MKALVYQGPGNFALEDKPKPVLQMATDAIIRVTKTTICGTDLHILKGDLPTVSPGRILGHEGVGVVDQVGAGVSTFKNGDHVLISCISSCGRCEHCKKGMASHCSNDGRGWNAFSMFADLGEHCPCGLAWRRLAFAAWLSRSNWCRSHSGRPGASADIG